MRRVIPALFLALFLVVAAACSHDAGRDSGSTESTGLGSTGGSGTPTVEVPTVVVPTVVVPNTKGMQVGDARKDLKLVGLSVVLSEELSHAEKGTVLSQSVDAGTNVVEGSLVKLTVAAPFPRIPNVVGKKLEQARRILEREGFKVRVKKQASTQPKDTVISQTPIAGTEARPGRTVALVVAKPTTGGDCQGYSPCIPPGPDVDCAGGSGDGPRYVSGPVRVTGSDPYGLDADNDGWGCE